MAFTLAQALAEYFDGSGGGIAGKTAYWGVSVTAGPITNGTTSGPVLSSEEQAAIDEVNPEGFPVPVGWPTVATVPPLPGTTTWGYQMPDGSVYYGSHIPYIPIPDWQGVPYA